MKQLCFKFEVCMPGEMSAGIIGFNDTITVIVDSGDPGGEPGEFEEYIREMLNEWYDGGSVVLVSSEQAKLHDDDCREKDALKKRIKELEDDIAKYKAFWDDSRLTDKMRWEKYDWPKHSEALMTIKDGKDE